MEKNADLLLSELEAVYATAPIGLGLMDCDLRFVRLNAHLAEINGLPVEAHLGRTLREILPLIAEKVDPLHRKVLESGEAILDLPLDGPIRPGEPPRQWLASFHPVRAHDGRMLGIGVVVQEQTALVALDRELRERRRELDEAHRLGRIGSWTHDLPSNRATWSAEMYRIFGVSPELPAPSFQEFLPFVHHEDRQRVADENGRLIAARTHEWESEFRIVRTDGAVRWLTSHIVASYDDVGRPVRLAGTNVDVTTRVELEARLRHAQKLEAIGQLAGGVAHDFNNLLTIISGHLEFVREALPSGPARADLDEVVRAAERGRVLVRQLLAFSRKQQLKLARIDLRQVASGAEGLLRRLLGDEIALRIELPDEPLPVLADAGQIEQLLMNLALNARHAMLTPNYGTDGTGGTLSILLRRTDAAWIELRIADDGHGMDAATREHAFEPFFTTKDVGEGSGLGLATVYGIVRQSGGSVTLDSSPGLGTVVTVTLPVARDEAVTRTSDRPDEARRAQTGTVLLVEDEPAVRATTRRFLQRSGFTVIEADDGLSAIDVWNHRKAEIDWIVSDLRMPELGGRQLAAHVRRSAQTPIVFISGYADDGGRPELDDHMTILDKPFTGKSLLAALASIG